MCIHLYKLYLIKTFCEREKEKEGRRQAGREGRKEGKSKRENIQQGPT